MDTSSQNLLRKLVRAAHFNSVRNLIEMARCVANAPSIAGYPQLHECQKLSLGSLNLSTAHSMEDFIQWMREHTSTLLRMKLPQGGWAIFAKETMPTQCCGGGVLAFVEPESSQHLPYLNPPLIGDADPNIKSALEDLFSSAASGPTLWLEAGPMYTTRPNGEPLPDSECEGWMGVILFRWAGRVVGKQLKERFMREVRDAMEAEYLRSVDPTPLLVPCDKIVLKHIVQETVYGVFTSYKRKTPCAGDFRHPLGWDRTYLEEMEHDPRRPKALRTRFAKEAPPVGMKLNDGYFIPTLSGLNCPFFESAQLRKPLSGYLIKSMAEEILPEIRTRLDKRRNSFGISGVNLTCNVYGRTLGVTTREFIDHMPKILASPEVTAVWKALGYSTTLKWVRYPLFHNALYRGHRDVGGWLYAE